MTKKDVAKRKKGKKHPKPKPKAAKKKLHKKPRVTKRRQPKRVQAQRAGLRDRDLVRIESNFSPKPGDIDFSNERIVLQVALENEILGRKLYMQYSKTLKNELAKRVFTHLANDELHHIEDIKKFIESLTFGSFVDVGSMVKPGTLENTKRLFGKLIEDLKEQVKPGDDDNRSRRLAMDIEKAGYEYYKKGAETTKNPQLKKFFEWLVEQEQSHYVLIRNAFEYMNSPDSWYAEQEHWLLEG
jgi:rubrerythrin